MPASANPKQKVAKKDKHDKTMNQTEVKASTGTKRPSKTDSDPDLDGLPSLGCSSASAAGPADAPATMAMMEQILAKYALQQQNDIKLLTTNMTATIDGRLTSMQEMTDSHFDRMATGFNKTLGIMSDKMNASELANQTKFDDIQAQILAINSRLAAPSTPLSFAAAASSQAGPAFAAAAPTFRSTTTGPAEDCLVFIRGFPCTQPGIVLREYANEALDILSTLARKDVKIRASPTPSSRSSSPPRSSPRPSSRTTAPGSSCSSTPILSRHR